MSKLDQELDAELKLQIQNWEKLYRIYGDLQNITVLENLVRKLRGPQGCPWDIEQTHESLIPYAIEETHEFVETLQENPRQDWKIKDELGDVLYQVMIHSQIAAEEQRFEFKDVVQNISKKLIRRHPHVFAQSTSLTTEEVLKNWDQIKMLEKKSQPADLHPKKKNPYFKIEKFWSALETSYRIGKTTEKYKFDWDNWKGALDKVEEEIQELRSADPSQMEEEIGDLFFSLSQLCRKLGFNPESVAKKSNEKFLKRFEAMVELSVSSSNEEVKNLAASDKLNSFISLTTEEKEELWRKIK